VGKVSPRSASASFPLDIRQIVVRWIGQMSNAWTLSR
jgi:hypothetical protein